MYYEKHRLLNGAAWGMRVWALRVDVWLEFALGRLGVMTTQASWLAQVGCGVLIGQSAFKRSPEKRSIARVWGAIDNTRAGTSGILRLAATAPKECGIRCKWVMFHSLNKRSTADDFHLEKIEKLHLCKIAFTVNVSPQNPILQSLNSL